MFRRFWMSEEGAGSVDFIFLYPVIATLFMSTFELGMLMTRQIMLDRGLDLAVREVRLGLMPSPIEHDDLKARICDRAVMIPDCMTQLKLEMRPVDPRDWAALEADADCVDRADVAKDVRIFEEGQSNELMLLRACSLFDPYFPTSGLGAQLQRESQGAYALVSSTAFVIEPN